MKFKVTVNKKTFEIEISPEKHEFLPPRIQVNGREYRISVSERWEKDFPKHIIIQNTSHEAEFDYGEDGFPKYIQLDGMPGEVEVDFLGKSKLSKARRDMVAEILDNTISSPMPGKIINILVKENQKVVKGNLCILLEAMKMENEIEAHKTGIVKKDITYRFYTTGQAVVTIPLLFDELYVIKREGKGGIDPKRIMIIDSLGEYIARSRLKANGKLKATEPPDIKAILKKAGLSTDDKPALKLKGGE